MGGFSERFLARAQRGQSLARPSHIAVSATPERGANKGKFRGACNRSACLAPGALYLNRGNGCYYCRACALLLNRANPDAPGGALCFLEPAVQAEEDAKTLARTLPAGAPRVVARL